MNLLRMFLISFALMGALPAQADGNWEPVSSYCSAIENAHEILDLGDAGAIRDEVERRYYHALDVSLAPRTISTRTPLFTWANEAKISCAKAWGFLKRRFIYRPEMDVEMVQRCDCFYSRMRHYQGWR